MKKYFDRERAEYPVYEDMIREMRGSVCNLSLAAGDPKLIHAQEKYGPTPGLMAYFRTGAQTSDAIQQLFQWHRGPDAKIERFLDFACGYGRATRFLLEDLGMERVWASDIEPEALAFLRDELGAQVVASAPRPEKFKPDGVFDCIFAGSLFSHLPEISFTRWLWKLYSLLAPGGLLIFSVHGETALPEGVTMPPHGIHFAKSSQSPSAEIPEYGNAFVAEHFVQTAICAVTGLANYQKIQQGLSFSQDIYLVAKGRLKESKIPFQFGPIGCVDFARWVNPGHLKVTGWAFDKTSGEEVVRVEAQYNSGVRTSCEVTSLRPDVASVLGCSEQPHAVRSGWEFELKIPENLVNSEEDWLLVKAISSSGRQFVLMLDHPASLAEFEAPQGWTYSESKSNSSEITSTVRYIYLPHNGRFLGESAQLSGWIATANESALQDLTLRGRFGDIPFQAVNRPDVSACQPGLVALGFEAILPPEYFTVMDPQLRFVTKTGIVLAYLDTKVESEAMTTIEGGIKELAMAEATS